MARLTLQQFRDATAHLEDAEIVIKVPTASLDLSVDGVRIVTDIRPVINGKIVEKDVIKRDGTFRVELWA